MRYQYVKVIISYVGYKLLSKGVLPYFCGIEGNVEYSIVQNSPNTHTHRLIPRNYVQILRPSDVNDTTPSPRQQLLQDEQNLLND